MLQEILLQEDADRFVNNSQVDTYRSSGNTEVLL